MIRLPYYIDPSTFLHGIIMIDLKAWQKRRERAFKELKEHLAVGRVDKDVITLLNVINSLPYAFTTSSCSGRIQLYEADMPGEKFELKTLGKWHSPVTRNDILEAVRGKNVWLAVLPPILHISTCSIESARHLLKILREAGFKRAGIISIARDGITIETIGTERLEMPVRLEGKDIIEEDVMPMIVKVVNSLLVRSKGRLGRLEEALKDEIARGLDNICGE